MSGREGWEAKRGWCGGHDHRSTRWRLEEQEDDLEGKIRGKAIRTREIWELGVARPIYMRLFSCGSVFRHPVDWATEGGNLYKRRRSEEVECEAPPPPLSPSALCNTHKSMTRGKILHNSQVEKRILKRSSSSALTACADAGGSASIEIALPLQACSVNFTELSAIWCALLLCLPLKGRGGNRGLLLRPYGLCLKPPKFLNGAAVWRLNTRKLSLKKRSSTRYNRCSSE